VRGVRGRLTDVQDHQIGIVQVVGEPRGRDETWARDEEGGEE
jgi:hypothetical protein